MIHKGLIRAVPESMKSVRRTVLLQWISLLMNIGIVLLFSMTIGDLWKKDWKTETLIFRLFLCILLLLLRAFTVQAASHTSFLASDAMKKKLKHRIYEKLLAIGNSYKEEANTAEAVQLASDGIDQLEVYFAGYLPQFFYSMLAPLTLFVVLAFFSLRTAVVLLVCIPLIPLSIVAVQRFAKKLLGKYWGRYTNLGDRFLENLQGLTTLKIYKADEKRHREMNEEAEAFRKITMKVLSMQLNSIIVMDIIAYGGAALGILLAIWNLQAGKVDMAGFFVILLLGAEFFLPLRQLGSYFHVAMNGIAASDKLFRLLDLEEKKEEGKAEVIGRGGFELRSVSASYDGEKKVLDRISMKIPEGSFVAVVGESGSGKSTLASLLRGAKAPLEGEILLGGQSLSEIREDALMRNLTYVPHASYILKGSIEETLRMGKEDASREEMEEALQRASLLSFVREEGGLSMPLTEGGSNLSGGQRQRLALARALLHGGEYWIFDEASSNIDRESEEAVMDEIFRLAEEKTVLLITHRMKNVEKADRIFVLKNGKLVEEGNHKELMEKRGEYYSLRNSQDQLEGGVYHEA